MIELKSAYELQKMRESAKIAAEILNKIKDFVKAGVRTKDIDKEAEKLVKKYKAIAAFKGYRGYPANVCISLNEQVVHGIPGDRIVQDGDIVSLDFGIKKDGYFGDLAITFAVGEVDSEKKELIKVAQESLYKGINKCYPGNRLFDVSHAIQDYVESHGFSVVRDFVGHGIGKKLHEEPQVPNYGEPNRGPKLKEGMVLAIEPMVNLGSFEVVVLEDNWTVVTRDGKPSAHFEHTVAITEEGPEVLTKI